MYTRRLSGKAQKFKPQNRKTIKNLSKTLKWQRTLMRRPKKAKYIHETEDLNEAINSDGNGKRKKEFSTQSKFQSQSECRHA